jgi:hypothetical protein
LPIGDPKSPEAMALWYAVVTQFGHRYSTGNFSASAQNRTPSTARLRVRGVPRSAASARSRCHATMGRIRG